VDAGSTWRPLLPDNQTLDIPSAFVDAAQCQEWKPGDWASGADGVFCYLEYWLQASVAAKTCFLDCVALMPADHIGYAEFNANTFWTQYRVFMLDAIGEPNSEVVYSVDNERYVAMGDWTGSYFTLPPLKPCLMVFIARSNSSPYAWDIAKTMRIAAKYRPRYRRVR